MKYILNIQSTLLKHTMSTSRSKSSKSTPKAEPETQSLIPSQIEKSIELYGDEYLKVDFTKPTSDKGGNVYYVSNYIKHPVTEKYVPLYLKISTLTVFKCKSPEDRAKEKLPASYSFNASAVDGTGEPVGRVMTKLDNDLFRLVSAYQAEHPDDTLSSTQSYKIYHHFVQTHSKNKETRRQQKLEDPLIRVLFRPTSKDDPTLNGTVSVMGPNGKLTNTTPEGNKFTIDNIHTVVTSRSKIIDVIDLSQMIFSSQGCSNTRRSTALIIVPGKGNRIDASKEYTSADIALLAGTMSINTGDASGDDSDNDSVEDATKSSADAMAELAAIAGQ